VDAFHARFDNRLRTKKIAVPVLPNTFEAFPGCYIGTLSKISIDLHPPAQTLFEEAPVGVEWFGQQTLDGSAPRERTEDLTQRKQEATHGASF
jgi:hypothetical protein